AREASKSHTYQVQAFTSFEAGLLGMIEPDDTIQYYRKPLRLHTVNSEFSNLNITNLLEVAIVYSYAGAKGDMINSIIDTNNYQGIVIAGTGAGLMRSDDKASFFKALKLVIVFD